MGRANDHNKNKNEQTLRLVQVTDSHLFAGEESTLVGMNCQQSFAEVLKLVRHNNPQLDCILCTGDLVQDASVEGYQRFFREVGELQAPQLWLAGNHDESIHMKQAVGRDNDCLHKSLLLGNWQLIMLDTHVEGKIYGRLSAVELSLLDSLLQESEASGHYALVCIHHNPIPVNAAWLQKHCLENAEDLFDVLDRYSHVRAVVFGHVHQEMNEQRKGVAILASPSTSIQFHPDNDLFTLDDQNPGYRWFQLFANGEMETGVERVEGNFHVDFSSTGY